MCMEGSIEHALPLFQNLHIMKFQDIFKLQTLKQMHLHFHNMITQPIHELLV